MLGWRVAGGVGRRERRGKRNQGAPHTGMDSSKDIIHQGKQNRINETESNHEARYQEGRHWRGPHWCLTYFYITSHRVAGSPKPNSTTVQPLTSPADLLELKVNTFYHLLSHAFLLIRLLSKIDIPYKLENNFLILLCSP